VILVASALPAAAAVGAVFVQGHRQRDAEHRRFLLTERFRSYAALLSAIDGLFDAGVTAAKCAKAPDRTAPSVAHMTGLLNQLWTAQSAELADTPELARWHHATLTLRRTALDAALRTADQHLDTLHMVVDFAHYGVASPLEEPDVWLDENSDFMMMVGSLRDDVERIARTEARITSGRSRKWPW
jgi:hypothetical protein